MAAVCFSSFASLVVASSYPRPTHLFHRRHMPCPCAAAALAPGGDLGGEDPDVEDAKELSRREAAAAFTGGRRMRERGRPARAAAAVVAEEEGGASDTHERETRTREGVA
jgi:hypothetical protein